MSGCGMCWRIPGGDAGLTVRHVSEHPSGPEVEPFLPCGPLALTLSPLGRGDEAHDAFEEAETVRHIPSPHRGSEGRDETRGSTPVR